MRLPTGFSCLVLSVQRTRHSNVCLHRKRHLAAVLTAGVVVRGDCRNRMLSLDKVTSIEIK